jgi:hypothetical protein
MLLPEVKVGFGVAGEVLALAALLLERCADRIAANAFCAPDRSPLFNAWPSCASGLLGLLALVRLAVNAAKALWAEAKLSALSAFANAAKFCWFCCHAAAPVWLAPAVEEVIAIPMRVSLAHIKQGNH